MKKTILSINLFFLLLTYASAATHNISMTEYVFSPSTMTINVGDVVVWTNNGTMAHTSTSGSGCSPNGTWNSGLISVGGTFSHTFNTAGTFAYFCSIHCALGMTGSITVNPSVSAVVSNVTLNLNVKSYPNPCVDVANLEFELTNPGMVKMEIYNMLGNKVLATEEKSMSTGKQIVKVDAAEMAAGIYLCKLFYNGIPVNAEYLIKSTR